MSQDVTPEQNENPSPEPKVHRSGYEKRIAKLTARNYQSETRVAELEAQVAELLAVLDERRRVMVEHAELVETENRILEVQVAHALAAKERL